MNNQKKSSERLAFLVGYTGKINRGTEALAVSTSAIFKEMGYTTVLVYHDNSELVQYPEYQICDEAIVCPVRHKLPVRILQALWFKIFHNIYPTAYFVFRKLLHAPENSIIVQIGGDTFCYGPSRIYNALVFWAKKKGYTTVLWGASIDESSLRNRLTLKTIKRYDKIYVREALSYKVLENNGFKDKLFKTSDPAFNLPKKDIVLDNKWWREKVIGINLSPFAMSDNKDHMLIINACIKIINDILSQTDWNIALIPHVWIDDQQGDYIPLNILANHFTNNPRVQLIHKDYNCCELKYVISKCYALLATRTHASIAAYSSRVPVLVLGYSIKSIGIATDLFGDYKGYVIPINEIKNQDEVYNAFMDIVKHHDQIVSHLEKVIPDYQKMSFSAAQDASNLI